MFFLACANYLNTFVLTPVLLALLGSDQMQHDTAVVEKKNVEKTDINEIIDSNVSCNKNVAKFKHKRKANYRRKRIFPIYKSELSLSTISEEPQLASVSNNDDNCP